MRTPTISAGGAAPCVRPRGAVLFRQRGTFVRLASVAATEWPAAAGPVLAFPTALIPGTAVNCSAKRRISSVFLSEALRLAASSLIM